MSRRLLLLLPLLLVTMPSPGDGHEAASDRLGRLDDRLQAHPSDLATLRLRGELLHREGQLAAALRDLVLAEQTEPGHPGTRAAMAGVLYDLHQWNQAAAWCDSLGSQRTPAAWRVTALIEQERGNPAAADHAWQQHLDGVDTPAPDAVLQAAAVARWQGDADLALRRLEWGCDVLGDPWVLLEQTAHTAMLAGQPSRATAVLNRAAVRYSTMHRFWMLSGDVHASAGNLVEATAAWNQALQRIDALPAHRRTLPLIHEDKARTRARLSPGNQP